MKRNISKQKKKKKALWVEQTNKWSKQKKGGKVYVQLRTLHHAADFAVEESAETGVVGRIANDKHLPTENQMDDERRHEYLHATSATVLSFSLSLYLSLSLSFSLSLFLSFSLSLSPLSSLSTHVSCAFISPWRSPTAMLSGPAALG